MCHIRVGRLFFYVITIISIIISVILFTLFLFHIIIRILHSQSRAANAVIAVINHNDDMLGVIFHVCGVHGLFAYNYYCSIRTIPVGRHVISTAYRIRPIYNAPSLCWTNLSWRLDTPALHGIMFIFISIYIIT